MDLSTSPPSLSPSPPVSVSKSCTVYPVVHPVLDPTAQAGFSSPSPHTAEHGDKKQKDSSASSPLSFSERADPISSPHFDYSTCNKKSSLPLSSTPHDEISSSLSNTDCENKHNSSVSHPVSVLHREKCERKPKNSLNNLENKQEVHKAAQETSEDKKLAEDDHMKPNGSCSLDSPRRTAHKSLVRSESCPTGAPSYLKERTVGKVSSAIDAKAQILAVLYETDHRPNATPALVPWPRRSPKAAGCVARKDHPGIGGSDVCHFCSKRVYVMERLSAEGYFFHRECFRCDICNCTLRLGGHIFDSQEAKFYCKMHYAQRQSSSHGGRFRRRMDEQSRVNPSSLASGSYSVTGSMQIQSPVRASSLYSVQLDNHQKNLPEDTEIAVEALDDSCIIEPTVQESTGARGQSQDSTKEVLCNIKQNNLWKRKIRATFPLIFIKRFQRALAHDREGPETVPEADSDFEEVTSTEKQSNSDSSSETSADAQNSSEGSEKSKEGSVGSSSSPKKRLMLSLSEKEKLLSWDMLLTAEEAKSHTNNKIKHQLQVQAETEADKLQTDSSQDVEQSNSQTSASSTSAFQLITNAFRRTFSMTNPPSSSNAPVAMRPKRDGNRKQRPMSVGALGLTSLFSSVGPEPSRDEKKTGKRDACWASVGSNPWESGRDLPSLLQSVSLKSRRDSEGVFSDDMASLHNKKVNLFSSLRLKKKERSENEGEDQKVQKEIMTILTNLSNKASSEQSLDNLSSSDDDFENLTSNQKLCSQRQRRTQEKMVAQQAKREHLKRLHRAQAIQRQLEEVAEKQRDLEERGVAIEKAIRGETDSSLTDESEEAQLYQSWFKLVLEKNRLARYESELMIFAQELELEDTQSRLQQDLRHRMAVEDITKSASELQEEQEILSELMRTVEKRDMLVSVLEEQRLKERAEDRDLESLVLFKGYEFNWVQADDSWGQEKLE